MADSGDFTKVLFSPPVLIGGAVVGVIILLMNSGSASAAAAASGGSAGPSAAQLGAIVSMNQSAGQNQVSLAQISAQSGAATLNANVTAQGQILSFLNNINNTNAQVNNTIITSQAGITNSSIASQTATALDINNNMERLNQAYVSSNEAVTIAGIQLQATQAQAKAAQNIALTQSVAGVLGSVVGGATKLATSSFNPTSLVSGSSGAGGITAANGYGTGQVLTDPGAILGI